MSLFRPRTGRRIFLASLFLFAVESHAAEGKGGFQVGLLAGTGIANGLTSFTYGIGVGYRLLTYLEVGATINGIGLGVPSGILSGYSASGVLTSLLSELNYYPAFIKSMYLGAKLGLTFVSSTLEGPSLSVSVSNSVLAFGPAIGYEFTVGSQFTLGPELDVILAPGADLTLFQLLARLKFRF